MTAILPDTTKNALLNSAATNGFVTSGTHLALFTAFPPIIGTNEVTGGSPAYARKVITFTASAAAGSISPATGLPATFDVPAGTTVKAVGVCTALTAGSLLAWLPAGSVARRAFSVDAGGVTADQLDAPGHGLSVNDQIIVWASIGAALPAGMAEDTIYFVKTVVDADTIEGVRRAGHLPSKFLSYQPSWLIKWVHGWYRVLDLWRATEGAWLVPKALPTLAASWQSGNPPTHPACRHR